MSSEAVAEDNYRMFIKAAEKAARMSARISVDLGRNIERWKNDLEKRTANDVRDELQAHKDQMAQDSRILNYHIERAVERGALSKEDASYLKEHVEQLKGAKGLQGNREASFEIREILNQYKRAEFKVSHGMSPKEAYKDIKDAPNAAMKAREQAFDTIKQAFQQIKDQMRENIYEKVR